MERDPGEMDNRIADPALAAEVARHRLLLDQWRKETRDETGNRPAVDKAKNKKNRPAAEVKA